MRMLSIVTAIPLIALSSAAFAQASISIKCGDSSYTTSTGNNAGSCETGTDSTGKWAKCTDSKGNDSFASCGNGCESSNGSGSCETKAAKGPNGPTNPSRMGGAGIIKPTSAGAAKLSNDVQQGKPGLTTTNSGLLGGTGSAATTSSKAIHAPSTQVK